MSLDKRYRGGEEAALKDVGANGEPRLLDQARAKIRLKHYSLRTEQVYLQWMRRYIRANGLRHPRELDESALEAFLTDLATRQRVSASTQNQALSALLFLYREVLAIKLPWMENVVRAKGSRRLPVVLSRGEVALLLRNLSGRNWLMASLLYGSGLRLMECLRLRVKDVDIARNEITVREGKGAKDRRTVLPASLKDALLRQMEDVRVLHAADLDAGFGAVSLPFALARKYPNAPKELGWQYMFPATRRNRDFLLMFHIIVVNPIVGHHRQQRHAGIRGGPQRTRRVEHFAIALQVDADLASTAVRQRSTDRRRRTVT